MILHDASNDIVCRLGGVAVMGELCTFVKVRLERVGGELPFASFLDILRTFPYILVTRAMFFRPVSPQISRNILKLHMEILVNHLSEVRWM